MDEPGDRRPPDLAPTAGPASGRGAASRPSERLRSRGVAIAAAAGVAILAAVAWALLRGILELGPGLLGVAAISGWAIGMLIRGANGSALVAMAIAAGAWLLGLIGTWLVSMAVLQGSTRTFAERLGSTPFLDWMSPQFGLLEITGLLVFVATAGYVARPRDRDGQGAGSA